MRRSQFIISPLQLATQAKCRLEWAPGNCYSRFSGENERGWAGGLQEARILEASLLQPSTNFFEGPSIALLGIDQHVDREKESVDRTGAFLVHQEILNGNRAAAGERAESSGQQFSAARLAFAVQDVTKSGEAEAEAKVGLEEIAFDKAEAIGEVEACGRLLCDVDDLRPVDGGDLDARRSLGLSDSPDTGAGGEVEDFHRVAGGAVVQVRSQGLRRGIAHREDVEDEFVKELAAGLLDVDRGDRIASGNDLVDVQPAGNELFTAVLDKAALEGGFGADQEGGAFGSEGVAAVFVFREEIEADERVHNGREAASGGAGGLLDFPDVFRAGVEDVEDAVADGGFKNKGRDVAPCHLHDAFRGDLHVLHRGCSCHGYGSSSFQRRIFCVLIPGEVWGCGGV